MIFQCNEPLENSLYPLEVKSNGILMVMLPSPLLVQKSERLRIIPFPALQTLFLSSSKIKQTTETFPSRYFSQLPGRPVVIGLIFTISFSSVERRYTYLFIWCQKLACITLSQLCNQNIIMLPDTTFCLPVCQSVPLPWTESLVQLTGCAYEEGS